jgi:hypothetical protein
MSDPGGSTPSDDAAGGEPTEPIDVGAPGAGAAGDATQPAMATTQPSGDEPEATRRRWWIPALLVVAGIVVGAGAVLLLTGGDDNNDQSAKSKVEVVKTVPTVPPSTVPTTTPPTTTPPTAAPSSGGSNTGGGSSGGTPQPTTPPASAAPTGPTITSFTSTATSFSCTTGATFQQPTDITLKWATQNATGVDLNVDGGLYGSYGPQGSQVVTVPCDGNAHTYKLIAKGTGGQTASQTITVTTTKH